jgi:glycerate 2-kinase
MRTGSAPPAPPRRCGRGGGRLPSPPTAPTPAAPPSPEPRAVRREDLLAIVHAGIAAAEPRRAVCDALETPGEGRVRVVGAGKGAAAMALGALDALGERLAGGTITVPHGTRADPRLEAAGVEVWHAGHPVPDAGSLAGAADALRAARAAGEDDLVLCLLSGGASALWAAPPAGVSLTDLSATARRLMEAGAPIGEVNAVRKHLSRIGGGRLARAALPARVLTLAVSDVVGGALDVIGSGPSVPDPTTYADALGVLRARGVQPPASAAVHLHAGLAGEVPETPKPGDPAFARASARVVASGRGALEAAAREAERRGYRAVIVADDLEGEAREVAVQVAGVARRALAHGSRGPVALLYAGETTVTVRGRGRGGRNQELALALAIELEGTGGVLAAAVGTDGVDGPTEAAGAFADDGTAARGRAGGLDPRRALEDNDSHTFLRAAGDLIVTGPTGTNVADLLVVAVGG